MLYNNDSYEENVQKISEAHGYLSIAGGLTFMVVRFIQYILRKVYAPINKMYMSLSREMEFHADAISASVTGGNHLISSLQRIEMGQICFNHLLEKYQQWNVEEKIKSNNLYEDHKFIQEKFADDYDLGFENEIIGTANTEKLYSTQRISVKDQWASHPSLKERKKFLESLKLTKIVLHDSPWSLFKAPNTTQKLFTEKLFSYAPNHESLQTISNSEFQVKFLEDINKHQLPLEFHGFFDQYFPLDLEIDTIKNTENISIDLILDKKEIKKLIDSTSLYHDIEILEYISSGDSDIESYDFDGERYKAKHATNTLNIIKAEAENNALEFKQKACEILGYYLMRCESQEKESELKKKFNYLVLESKNFQKDADIYAEIHKTLAPIFQGSTPFEIAENINTKVKELEVILKDRIRANISKGRLKSEDFTHYLKLQTDYFYVDTFNEQGLEILFNNLNGYQDKLGEQNHNLKKEFLVFLLEL